VSDVVSACVAALERPEARGGLFNVGSGVATSIVRLAGLVAAIVAESMGTAPVAATVTGFARLGDIRHCTADMTRARCALGFVPQVELEDGLRALLADMAGTTPVEDQLDQALDELRANGLLAGALPTR
jgi:dTDP-L-rhamnose 4-epimerase